MHADSPRQTEGLERLQTATAAAARADWAHTAASRHRAGNISEETTRLVRSPLRFASNVRCSPIGGHSGG